MIEDIRDAHIFSKLTLVKKKIWLSLKTFYAQQIETLWKMVSPCTRSGWKGCEMVFKVRMVLEGWAISSLVLGKDEGLHLLLVQATQSKEVAVKCVEELCVLVGSVILLCYLSKRRVIKEPKALILLWKHRERETIFCPYLADWGWKQKLVPWHLTTNDSLEEPHSWDYDTAINGEIHDHVDFKGSGCSGLLE